MDLNSDERESAHALTHRLSRQAREREVPFDIDPIVSVSGNTTRGKQPFPHPFPARMPMEVAREAVLALSRPGDVILDPMTGSGVVPKAASALGRHGVGRDIDPLAVIQARALCAGHSVPEIAEAATGVIEEARQLVSWRGTEKLWAACDSEDLKFLDYWFEREHADELFALGEAVKKVKSIRLRPVMAAIMSSLIISRGSGASRAMDLSRSRPHRVAAKVPRSPFAQWQTKVAAFARYYDAQHLMGRTDIALGDARDLEIEDDSVDAVVTSPPYVNAIDYMRMSKFTLVFFGEHLADLRQTRATSIGTEVGLAPGVLPRSLDQLVEEHVAEPKRRPMLRRYISDLRESLAESFRVLKPSGRALYVMGPSILSRRDYDAARVLIDVATSVGFQPLAQGRRDLNPARRSLPPPRRSQRNNAINRRMSCEFYVALQKTDE